MISSLAIKLMFKYERKLMKEKLSDITFNKIHVIETNENHGTQKLTIFTMIIVTTYSGEIRKNHLNHENFSDM